MEVCKFLGTSIWPREDGPLTKRTGIVLGNENERKQQKEVGDRDRELKRSTIRQLHSTSNCKDDEILSNEVVSYKE